jgi:hypothetical protein
VVVVLVIVVVVAAVAKDNCRCPGSAGSGDLVGCVRNRRGCRRKQSVQQVKTRLGVLRREGRGAAERDPHRAGQRGGGGVVNRENSS